MDKLTAYAPFLARLFLAALFLMAAFGKLADVQGFTGYLTSGGLPAFLAWPSIIFEVVLGLSMLAGFQARIMALLGASFCVVSAILYHFQPADQIQMTMFLKNFAIAGGFLMIFAHGPGKLAVDKA